MLKRSLVFFLVALTAVFAAQTVRAESLALPTTNTNLWSLQTVTNYFVPTVGRTWESGTFGCVRTDRQQLHEGIDIKPVLKRDKKGEATDPILCTADGIVVHINTVISHSNYGRYVIVKHKIDGLEIYSIYAHLASISPNIKVGTSVSQGATLGVMGRSANTRAGISKERAHLHFELCFFLNPNFDRWYNTNYPPKNKNQGNHHGNFHGWNLVGIDPWDVFLRQKEQGQNFSLLNYVRGKTGLCRVFVSAKELPFAKRYPTLIKRNTKVESEGISGWEIYLDFNGVPYTMIPRAASEISTNQKYTLIEVNGAEQELNPARHFLKKSGNSWVMTTRLTKYLDQLFFR